MRQFQEKTTLDDARESTEYTVDALEAWPDKVVQALARPLHAVLETLAAIESRRRDARRALTRANARVRIWDAFADDLLREFNKDLLGAARQNRSSDLYRAFIPDDLAALTDLSLEPESAAFTAMLAELKKKTTPEALRKRYVPEFERVVTHATAALQARGKAISDIASADADFARWKDQANRRRRAVDGSLTTHAAEKGLPADFNERFQPAVGGSQRAKKKTVEPVKPG